MSRHITNPEVRENPDSKHEITRVLIGWTTTEFLIEPVYEDREVKGHKKPVGILVGHRPSETGETNPVFNVAGCGPTLKAAMEMAIRNGYTFAH